MKCQGKKNKAIKGNKKEQQKSSKSKKVTE